mmetsp:Transcript_28874/g.62181  ORF Transcript_28874/g.62181 Transcript_28874/m.62181 type:complete len:104 (+) Transcript_28874:2703-3014(+)
MYSLIPSCLTGASKTFASRVDPTTLKNSLTALVMSGMTMGCDGCRGDIVDSENTVEEKTSPEKTADRTAVRNDTMLYCSGIVLYWVILSCVALRCLGGWWVIR